MRGNQVQPGDGSVAAPAGAIPMSVQLTIGKSGQVTPFAQEGTAFHPWGIPWPTGGSMAESSDDIRLGEMLVGTGQLSREDLQDCFEAQRQAGGSACKRLIEILAERGHIVDLGQTGSGSRGGQKAGSPEIKRAVGVDRRLIGRYEVVEELGRGGMGVVFRAHDPRLRRDVAIKLIRGGGKLDEAEACRRFLREARVTARLRHPCIVGVYEVGLILSARVWNAWPGIKIPEDYGTAATEQTSSEEATPSLAGQ